jgi:hypothetical protein
MAGREFDEVWDPDLMKQQLGELRKEAARLKAELAHAKKAGQQIERETTELRRLVQDGHLREKHLRARYHELLKQSSAEAAGTQPGAPQSPSASAAASDETRPGGGPRERVDPALVDRLAENEAPTDGWPTPESTLPSLATHPGWGNYASKGEAGVVIGISLLGLDHNARQDVIDLVAGQQLRNPQLFPLFITDDDDFRALRAEHFVFEYLPPWPGEDVVPSRERWQAFLAERLALIKKKWGVRRFVSFGQPGYDPLERAGAGGETVQRELLDTAKD